ncbi:hypothetical protein [Rhizobacter sp. P5_C2]
MKYPALRFTNELSSDPTIGDLSAAQRRLLLERLSYVIELCEKMDGLQSRQEIREFLTDIELDAWVNIGAPEDVADKPISSWLVHVSWASAFSDGEPLSAVERDVRDRLTSVGDVSSAQALTSWMSQQAAFIRACATHALASVDLASFVGHTIGMNVLLLNLLSTIGRARLMASWLKRSG